MSFLDRFRRRRHQGLSCQEVALVLQQYLDGELDAAAAPAVAAHLEQCRRCGLEADVYRDLLVALSRLSPPPRESVDRLRDFGERLVRGEAPEHEHDHS